MRFVNRGVVPIGRTAVSKTDGWEFESLHPCQIPEGLAEMLGLCFLHNLLFFYLHLFILSIFYILPIRIY